MVKEAFPVINQYRLSKFVIYIDNQEGWILYNTATGSIVSIKNEKDLYKSQEELIKMFFFVPQTFDEILWIKELRASYRFMPKERIISGYTILTTMDCNARCFYCYEKGQPPITMSEKTANEVADFMIKSSSGTSLDIRWFGGEPLVNTTAIDIICDKMVTNGVPFKSSIISNGLLFSDKVIKNARELWNLKKVQITLDGTKDVYQKTKAYKGARGNEFERVIENIFRLINANIRVSIRLNQAHYNTTDLIDLADFLSAKFAGKKLVSVYNCWLYNENEKYDETSNAVRYKEFIRLQEKLFENGLFRNNPLNKKLRYHHCMADNDSSIIISPKGDLCKCEHFIANHIVGSIYDAYLDNNEIQKWKEVYQPTQKCIECPLYPQCHRIKLCPEEKEFCSMMQCENKIELIKRALSQKYQSI